MFPFIVTSAGVCLPIWSYELIKGKELSRPHLSPCGLALYFYVKHPHSIYWTEGWIVAQENERRKNQEKVGSPVTREFTLPLYLTQGAGASSCFQSKRLNEERT